MISIISETNALRAKKAADARKEADYDRKLVLRFNAGDESAFTEIVNRYRGMMFSVALRFIRNRADAEEIAQDTFIRAYRALPMFRGDSSLSAWLYHITANLSRNRYWYFFRRRRHVTCSFDMPIGEEGSGTFSDFIASEGDNPSQKAAVSEFTVIVDACMKKLSRSNQEVLTMRIEQHLSYEQIAEALYVDIGTVKSRIARARMNLLGNIAAACPELAYRDEIAELLVGDNKQCRLVRAV